MIQYHHAKFLLGAWQPKQFPPDDGAEVAFIGRSNAGKSSALNAVVGRQALARVSKTPGRTQLINFFELSENRRIADLPGYGYAEVPAKMREHWRALLSAYFEQRRSLTGCMLIVDSRRGLGDYDRYLLHWARGVQLPMQILLTKADKLSQSAAMQAHRAVVAELKDTADVLLFSATTKRGVAEAQAALQSLLQRETPALRAKKNPGESS
jgi:GTP-binding protein